MHSFCLDLKSISESNDTYNDNSVQKIKIVYDDDSYIFSNDTATTVAAAALKLAEYDRYLIHLSRISAPSVHQVAAMFQSMNKDQIASLGYMHPGRVDVITAGTLVLSRIMAATGASEFIASESDILDGIAWSLSK